MGRRLQRRGICCRGCRSRPALRLDKGGNLMTRLVLAALVLLNCASFTTKLFAQASQTAPPVPLTAPSVNTTTVTCQINCDSQAMSCQNSCVPTTAAVTSGATGGGAGETGYVEGRDAAIEFHWADSQYDRLPAMAAELVRRQVAVLVAGAFPAALAAKTATSTIPIVFSIGVDPVAFGLVTSLNRPGGVGSAGIGADQINVAHRPRLLSDNGPSYVSVELAACPAYPRRALSSDDTGEDLALASDAQRSASCWRTTICPASSRLGNL